jgi:hypothetical protein
VGALRVGGLQLVPALVGATPPEPLLERLTVVDEDDALAASRAELGGTLASVRELRHLEQATWGDLPVRVVSAAGAPPADRTFHARLAARSSRGAHVVLPSGGHYVHYDAPSPAVDMVDRLLDDAGTRAVTAPPSQ